MVPIVKIYENESFINLFLEYEAGGTLKQRMKSNSIKSNIFPDDEVEASAPFTEEQARLVCA